ncbi:MAG: ribonuclease III [Gammaproteobacteria bacterium]
MTASEGLERFQHRLGYRFRDPQLLARALTHRSAPAPDNERLEFLGDGLINFAVAEALYRARPQAEEGDLSRLRASLVCEESLARVAAGLELGELLALGGGALKSGGFRRAPILADALEAVLGAVYLDGGFEAGRAAVEHVLAASLADLPDAASLKDAKTRLQEFLQGAGRPLPVYELLSSEGPEHRPSFRVSCRLADGGDAAEGQAASRRAAEQSAAEQMLRRLGVAHA